MAPATSAVLILAVGRARDWLKPGLRTELDAIVGVWSPALRACFKIRRGPVFAEKVFWRGETSEHTRPRSVSEEQRSQKAFSAKTLRAAGLLTGAFVGSALTARCGDAPASPPRPRPKSLAAGPRPILKQAQDLHPAHEPALCLRLLDCGGKRSATPLWRRLRPCTLVDPTAPGALAAKRRRRCALPAQSKTGSGIHCARGFGGFSP